MIFMCNTENIEAKASECCNSIILLGGVCSECKEHCVSQEEAEKQRKLEANASEDHAL